jgi:hypothetical protein
MVMKKSALYFCLWASCGELRGGMDEVAVLTLRGPVWR